MVGARTAQIQSVHFRTRACRGKSRRCGCRGQADRLLADGGIPPHAEADAIHIAVASVHGMDYLLTWNCRHIDNATTKPVIRSICAVAGYTCPEICTPLELLSDEVEDVQG